MALLEGTRVFIKKTPLSPPAGGGKAGGEPDSLSASVETGDSSSSSAIMDDGSSGFLIDRMDDGNSGSLPACGEGWGGVWIPIEDVKPGDFVFSHDGQFHRVTRVLHAKYTARTITFECPDLQCKLSATEDQLVLIHRGRASFANPEFQRSK